MHRSIRTAVVGASGYTGAELVRLLLSHPNATIEALVAESNAGKALSELYPVFLQSDLPPLVKLDQVDFSNIDVAFCCLPHATSQEVIMSLPEHVRVIDLSADYRIKDGALYEQWYQTQHLSHTMREKAVYGLTEWYRDKLTDATLVACPGCYPTSMLLPILPLLAAEKIDKDSIIVDAKSGVSGAGRSAKTVNLFTEVNESVRAYGVGGHRHVAEVEEQLSFVANDDVRISFTPQVVPMTRGILSTIYVKHSDDIDAQDLYETLASYYTTSPFISIYQDYAPQTSEVSGTNFARIGVFNDRISGRSILVSVIDNLIKGSSGQAIQNFNVMFDLDETTGLGQLALLP